MYKLEGDFGSIVFEQKGNSRYVTIPTGTALTFFKKLAVVAPDIAMNQLGLYSFATLGRNGKAKFAALGTPKHILQKRNNGCVWNPKGKMPMTLTEVELCPIEYMGEQCPDAFWDSCFEQIFGTGNDVRDFFATPEGQNLVKLMLQQIYTGLGNSYYDLAWFGQHPLIDDSDANGWYGVDPQEWADYKNQQVACGGFMTLIDYYKEVEGRDNFNIPIYRNEVDGEDFVGDAFDLLDRAIRKATGTFGQILRAKTLNGIAPTIQVSAGIFRKLEDQLLAKFAVIPAMYQYWMTGTDGTSMLMPGVLKHKGFNVVLNDAWGAFDALTGCITHRVVVSAPGVFGMANDVPDVKQFEGMGLRVTQHLDAPYMGKIYMDTTFKMTATLLDIDLLNNASLVLRPS